MSDTIPEEQVEAARAYESLLVPALFREWAPRVLDAVNISARHSLLDVACGTGVVAREAHRVNETLRVVGADIAPGMLAVAQELAPNLEWRLAPAERLPCDDSTFDAVTCQFGLMFFPGRVEALRKMLRVLRPGGVCAVVVWDRPESMEAIPTMIDLLQRRAGSGAADALRAPFTLGDIGTLESLFDRAGATELQVATEAGTARFPSVRSMVDAELRGWLPLMGVVLEEETIASILAEAERALESHVEATGELVFRTSGHLVTTRTIDQEGRRGP